MGPLPKRWKRGINYHHEYIRRGKCVIKIKQVQTEVERGIKEKKRKNEKKTKKRREKNGKRRTGELK